MNLKMRPIDPENKDGWLALWRAYHEHYDEIVSADLTFTIFDRLIKRDEPLRGRIAFSEDDEPVGFVNYFLHPSSWSTRDVCFVEDVFVGAKFRRQGVGRELIEDVARVVNINRWSRLYMAVPGTDDVAMAFFASLAEESDWVVFDYPLRD